MRTRPELAGSAHFLLADSLRRPFLCARGVVLDLNSQPKPSSEGAQAQQRHRRGGWARLCAFLLLIVLAVSLVTVTSRSMPVPPRVPFNDRPLVFLTRLQPEYVLIGNSMVGTRFDEATLRRLLRPHALSVMGANGAKSAVWYLMLKNLVIASGSHPRVLLFFRDQELTTPRERAVGAEHERVERVALDSEPTVERKLAPPRREPIARFEWYRERFAPLIRLRRKTEPLLDAVAVFFSRLSWPEPDPERRKSRINELFALGNLRGGNGPAEPAPVVRLAFKDVVDESFLPDICALAKEHAIALSFVRIRTRRAAEGQPETPFDRQYKADLERYVRAFGAEFYDMYDATWESIDMFGDGDHIAARFKRRYTELFVEHMGGVFH
jgi:hypothetical protein